MNELEKGLSQESVSELPSEGLLCFLRALPRLATSPGFSLAISKAAVTGDYSDERFKSPEMVDVLSSMSRETSTPISFTRGSKVIVANHTSLTAVLPAIARRMPDGEDMPYLFSDIYAPYKAGIDPNASRLRRTIAKLLLRIELSIPFVIPNLPLGKVGLRQEILSLAGGEGRIFTGKGMLRKIQKCISEKESPSFIVFIENIASRGTTIHSPDPDLVHLVNILIRMLSAGQLVFLAYNSGNDVALAREIHFSEIAFEIENGIYADADYFEMILNELMADTLEHDRRF